MIGAADVQAEVVKLHDRLWYNQPEVANSAVNTAALLVAVAIYETGQLLATKLSAIAEAIRIGNPR